VEEFPGYHLFYNLTPSNNSTWVDVTSLDPTVNMGTTGAVNVPNTVGITAAPTTLVNFGSNVASGGTVTFAWFDDNGVSPSPDQDLGLNNVSIQAVPEPSPVGLGLIGVCTMLGMLYLRRRVA
jgi:hypothetical protein